MNFYIRYDVPQNKSRGFPPLPRLFIYLNHRTVFIPKRNLDDPTTGRTLNFTLPLCNYFNYTIFKITVKNKKAALVKKQEQPV